MKFPKVARKSSKNVQRVINIEQRELIYTGRHLEIQVDLQILYIGQDEYSQMSRVVLEQTKLTLSRYLQSVIQEEVRSDIKTYLGMVSQCIRTLPIYFDFLFFLSMFLFLDNEEICDHSHIMYHIVISQTQKHV